DLDEVRVLDAAEDHGLGPHLLHVLLLGRVGHLEHFEGDGLFRELVQGHVDLAHAPRADQAHDLGPVALTARRQLTHLRHAVNLPAMSEGARITAPKRRREVSDLSRDAGPPARAPRPRGPRSRRPSPRRGRSIGAARSPASGAASSPGAHRSGWPRGLPRPRLAPPPSRSPGIPPTTGLPTVGLPPTVLPT